MNETLVKILDRYELDKPILMLDKLDCIWDKKEHEQLPKKPAVDAEEAPLT